ncbi:MAG TPA: cobalamin/Fe3+-siderophore ABC transporter ATP-binding protein [Firmicutes bacterium]|jgi:iron complex transport system ATP-binding protein|nr:cobalamin/Fe3+-siderophore ABC transporter ATP-binding protein [Bacillota bacterium]
MTIITTDQLAIGYSRKIIIDNINLEALKGQIVCLLGPNGSGKTTMLRTLSGLLAPVKGTVYLNDKDLNGYKGTDLSKNIAVLLTEKVPGLYMTVFEMVAMGRYPYTDYAHRLTSKDTAKVWEALERVNGVDLAEKNFLELSDGERQKALLARALTQEPELLVLDEPTSFLDIRHKYEIIEVFNRLAQEKKTTIILSVHDIELAVRCCDIAILLKENQIVGYGPPEKLLTETSIRDLYGLQRLTYNELLGVAELSSPEPPSVFVIAGNGTGVRLYRLLSRYHYGVCSGIIHENDVDYQVGKSLKMEMIMERAFEGIGEPAFQKAEAQMVRMQWVIDAGYPVGAINARNVDLVKRALAMNKPVLSLRNYAQSCQLFGDKADQIKYCPNDSGVIEALSQYKTGIKATGRFGLL